MTDIQTQVTLADLEKTKFFIDSRAEQVDINYRFSNLLGSTTPLYQCISNTDFYFIFSSNLNQNTPEYTVLPDRHLLDNTISLRVFSVPLNYENNRILTSLNEQYLPESFPNRSEVLTLESLNNSQNFYDTYHNYLLETINNDLALMAFLFMEKVQKIYPTITVSCQSAIETFNERNRLSQFNPQLQVHFFYQESFASVILIKKFDSKKTLAAILNKLDTLSIENQDLFILTLENCLKETLNEHYSI